MKIKKLYTCEICRTDYADKEKAVSRNWFGRKKYD